MMESAVGQDISGPLHKALSAVRAFWLIGFLINACLFSGFSGCALAVDASPVSGPEEWVHQDRVFRTPGGQTRIEQWSAASDQAPQVVRAQRYVSGMSLAPGIALVFHATQQRWMLSLGGQLSPVQALQQGSGDVPWLAQRTPNLGHFAFVHEGRQWQLMILGRGEPKPLPGIATEQEQSLDLVLWQAPQR